MIKNDFNGFFKDEISKCYLLEYRETLLEYIENEKFQNHLDKIIKDRNFSVFSLLDLFIEYLNKSKSQTSQEWLNSIYNWVINKSFPNKGSNEFDMNLNTLYKFFLNSYGKFLVLDNQFNDDKFIQKYPISFLTVEEELNLNISQEYYSFKSAFIDYYIYELMNLDMAITGHNTLDHVIGVNYLSMYIARQLYELGLPVDLGVVVGASLGHDIGKYGVLDKDKSKVPYYHYYYTEEWFKKFKINKIGHIATNHSTWDLELETLPLESLILIYADFRVKNFVENNIYTMHMFPLKESFDVILNKLDNVDEAKENRYKKVYKKLRDFEDYIISLGVDTTLEHNLIPSTHKPFELMDKNEVMENIKYKSIEHNIILMSKLTDNVSFNYIIETARGETNWRRLKLYLQIFHEYSTYLTQKQKITTLHFLSDLLLHKGEDIRKESAELIGRLISLYDEEYRKELPPSIKFHNSNISSADLLDEFLYKLLHPSHKVADSQGEWLYNLKTLFKSLFRESHISLHKMYFDVLSKYFDEYTNLSDIGQFYLCQTIDYIPIKSLDENRLIKLFTYTIMQLDSNDMEIRLTTLDSISQILVKTNDIMFIASIRNWIVENLEKSSVLTENYLKYIIGKKINISPEYQDILDKNYRENETSEIFLQNLKTATEWVIKKINIDMLYDQVVENPSSKGFHVAMHLCNILKVSAIERVRNYSGITLVNIFPLLSLNERNDVAIELLRALEMESYQFTKYIPKYFGQLILYLRPRELDEIIDDFESKIKVSSTNVIFLLLNTIVISIENYEAYKIRFDEDQTVHAKRLNKLLGLLFIAMASYNVDVKNESLRIMSSALFTSNILSFDEKYKILNTICKKLLTFLDYNEEDEFLFYNNASSLNHIYKFISEYEFHYGHTLVNTDENIAFFPGSFDPFSLSHKEIATEIRNLDFQVYLAVDEFSWSKRTEPHAFRRDIINMSIADEMDIHLFPNNIPINISNPSDLDKLKGLFPDQKVFIVVGSDVLINASAYKNNSPILDFPHIVFDRKSSISKDDDEAKLESSIANIHGGVVRLSLPPQYEDISSTQIRQNIDLNRDISKFIDPLAQSFIYNYGLYLREPQYKTLLETKTIEVETLKNIDENILDELHHNYGHTIHLDHLKALEKKPNHRLLLVRDSKSKAILGFSSYYGIHRSRLYDEFQDTSITDYLRRNAKGRIMLISGICALNNDEELIEIVINETLALSVVKDYNFSMYSNALLKEKNPKIEEHFLLQGFLRTDHQYNYNRILIVDMNNPITLNLDLENMLKSPYDIDPKITKKIRSTRNLLKKSLTKLYPGQLILTFNRDMIYSKLIQKICDSNDVSIFQPSVRELGLNMCVPFGSILNNSIIPNTVTKTLHTEKIFKTNIKDFTIGSYPFYLSLEDQAKVLKSFNRPVILVDDLLNKGYRINVIEPILKNAGVEIKKVIVGILSGRGKEIGQTKNLDIDSAYFVPNLNLWFNESSLYPYIGGDMVENNELGSISIPSINMILPYVSPRFIKNTTNDALYNLSETCLKNTFTLFKALEELYQSINEKNLNIKGLGEVIISPRHPDMSKNIAYNNMRPSAAIENDLEYLNRLENIIRR
ncbi:cytidyltransferase [Tissierella sp.]|uniref:cytidyltransferase n=1 Tax=Tissierella sp. TaxID=41274 RepID=UPI0028577FCE|nr:cytidyltransferase [Tissierella sp.]MDR7855800.1 cytidyltransferase [Tissierella sp.]